jgi:hypothetical protein
MPRPSPGCSGNEDDHGLVIVAGDKRRSCGGRRGRVASDRCRPTLDDPIERVAGGFAEGGAARRVHALAEGLRGRDASGS